MKQQRIHILLSPSLKNRIASAVPRGIRSDFMRTAIEMAVEAMEEHGPAFLGLLLAGEVVFKPDTKLLSAGQNLTPSAESTKEDEKRAASH